MMTAIAVLLAAAAPTAEAEALGLRLAQRGMLAAMLPMIVAKDTEELVAAHPDLAEGEKARLRAAASAQAAEGSATLFAAIGRTYAAALPVADLKALVAFQESPVAARYKAAEPQAIAAAMQAMQGMDFKRDAWARFCRGSAAKGCPARD